MYCMCETSVIVIRTIELLRSIKRAKFEEARKIMRIRNYYGTKNRQDSPGFYLRRDLNYNRKHLLGEKNERT